MILKTLLAVNAISALIAALNPQPLTFTERRNIIARNWLRYGYGRRTRPASDPTPLLCDKVNRLLTAQIVR